MENHIIGKSRIIVSKLGMGCWSYGGGSYWGSQAQSDVNDVVAAALDKGITYFDTAEVYNNGDSESSLGIALKNRRSMAVIGTKVSTSNAREQDLIASCENSLKRLGTDYIDIYMLHWPINKKSAEHFGGISELPTLEESFGAMQKLKKQGKIREIGLSNHGVIQMQEVKAVCDEIAVNELPYNLISRAIETDIQEYCVKNSIAIFGYMAYQQGILAGIYKNLEEIPEPQAHSRHFAQARGGNESRHYEDGAEMEILSLMDYLQKVALKLNVSVSTLSLSWAISNRAIASTLVGSRNIEQLMENIKICDYIIPVDVKKELDNKSLAVLKKLGSSPDYYENRKNTRIY